MNQDPGNGGVNRATETSDREGEISDLRQRILDLDGRLVQILAERREIVLELGLIKQALGLPVLDPAREARVIRRAAREARALGIDEEMVRDILWRVIASARNQQEGRSSWGPQLRPF